MGVLDGGASLALRVVGAVKREHHGGFSAPLAFYRRPLQPRREHISETSITAKRFPSHVQTDQDKIPQKKWFKPGSNRRPFVHTRVCKTNVMTTTLLNLTLLLSLAPPLCLVTPAPPTRTRHGACALASCSPQPPSLFLVRVLVGVANAHPQCIPRHFHLHLNSSHRSHNMDPP